MLFRFLGLNWLDKFSWNWLSYIFYDVTRFPYWTTSKAKSLVGLASLPFPFFLPSLIWSLNFKNWPLHCLIQISYFFIMEQWPVSEILKVSRAVGRSENPGVPILFGGHNLPPLVNWCAKIQSCCKLCFYKWMLLQKLHSQIQILLGIYF